MDNGDINDSSDNYLFTKDESLNEQDTIFVQHYNSGYLELSDDVKVLAFKNVIKSSGSCGFAGGGTIDYLVNTDTKNSYRVTIEITWRRGIEKGKSTRIVTIKPGQKMSLGCTMSNRMPITKWNREIVGEEIYTPKN